MVTAFLVIGGLGLLLLLVSFIAGEFLSGVFDGVLGGDVISGAAISGFLAALGFVGAPVAQATDNSGAAIISGVAAGGLIGWGVGAITRALMQGGDEATVRISTLVGATGTVIGEIPDFGYGQVSLTVAGHITRLNARSPEPIEAGTAVTVTAVLSPTSVQVVRTWTLHS